MNLKRYETPNEFLLATKEAGLPDGAIKQVSPFKWQPIMNAMRAKFFPGANQNTLWLWEHHERDKTIRLIDDTLNQCCRKLNPNSAVYLAIEDCSGRKKFGCHWLFEGKLCHVVDTLNEMRYLEYYIMDKGLNWLWSEDHHGMVVGHGELLKALELKQ